MLARGWSFLAFLASAALLSGCSSESDTTAKHASGGAPPMDASDAKHDAPAPDAGKDASVEASTDGPSEAAVDAGTCPNSIADPVQTAPIVDVTTFGAKGDDTSDDTMAIQSAIDSMTNGGTLVFPKGKYLYGGTSGSSEVIHVSRANVALWGYGAELRSENKDAQEIELAADNTAIYGFLLTSPQFDRQSAPNNHRIVLRASGNQVVDVHIDGGAAAGIFVYGADHFTIARNIVENTEADSIHMTQNTQPSHDGHVIGNTVHAPDPYWGDDLVAVIGYLGSATPDSMTNANYNILIECNDLVTAGWGNGVDIGGGKDITIRYNHISDIAHVAGIKLGTEASYPTFSTLNVLVEHNDIHHIQTTGTTKDGSHTSFGAFELAARQPQTSVRKVYAHDNSVDDTLAAGVRFDGTICDIGFEATTMTNIGGTAFGVISPDVPSGCIMGCAGNTDDGAPATSNLCTGSAMPSVTGASL